MRSDKHAVLAAVLLLCSITAAAADDDDDNPNIAQNVYGFCQGTAGAMLTAAAWLEIDTSVTTLEDAVASFSASMLPSTPCYTGMFGDGPGTLFPLSACGTPLGVPSLFHEEVMSAAAVASIEGGNAVANSRRNQPHAAA